MVVGALRVEAVAGVRAWLVEWFHGVMHCRAEEVEPGSRPDETPDPNADSGEERRASARRTGRAVRVFLTDAGANTKLVDGWVLDRSLGGICLSLYEAVQVGEVLRLMPENAPAGTPWVEVEVRSVRLDGGRHELHCQFLQNLPYAVLVLFR